MRPLIIIRKTLCLVVLLLAMALMTGVAQASYITVGDVTVDGMLDSGEYTGGVDSGTDEILWWNNHESIYTKAAGHKNNLNWEINGSGSNHSLNVFFEVPTYARRMIWDDSVTHWKKPGDFTNGIPEEYLAAYADNHHGFINMSYQTQTGSEYFELNNGNESIKKIAWQAEDENGLDDEFTWYTSRQYLINEGECTTSECYKYNMTSSIEMMWSGLASGEAEALLGSITDMELHLSDEARDLPEVPVPAAVWLLGSGLVGLAGIRRKKKQ